MSATADANVTNSLELLLGREHSDIGYLKKDKISNVLSKALSETFRLQPNDPVQFFANYLLNHNKTMELAYQVSKKITANFLRTKPTNPKSTV
jgi:hypothetical protein